MGVNWFVGILNTMIQNKKNIAMQNKQYKVNGKNTKNIVFNV